MQLWLHYQSSCPSVREDFDVIGARHSPGWIYCSGQCFLTLFWIDYSLFCQHQNIYLLPPNVFCQNATNRGKRKITKLFTVFYFGEWSNIYGWQCVYISTFIYTYACESVNKNKKCIYTGHLSSQHTVNWMVTLHQGWLTTLQVLANSWLKFKTAWMQKTSLIKSLSDRNCFWGPLYYTAA